MDQLDKEYEQLMQDCKNTGMSEGECKRIENMLTKVDMHTHVTRNVELTY